MGVFMVPGPRYALSQYLLTECFQACIVVGSCILSVLFCVVGDS